jgi:hypothetical protein
MYFRLLDAHVLEDCTSSLNILIRPLSYYTLRRHMRHMLDN